MVWRCAARNTATASEDRGSRYSAGRIAVRAIAGRWSVFNSNSASRTHGSGLSGARRTASLNARRAAVLRPAAVSIVASVNSGSSESGLASRALLGLRARRVGLAAVQGVQRVLGQRVGAHRLPDRPRRGDDEQQRSRPHRWRAYARAAPARRRSASARPAGPIPATAPPAAGARLAFAAQRPAPGDPARRQQRDRGVGGHDPRPVDERVHAEDDHDGDERQQADPLGRERTPAIAPPQARWRRAALASQAASSARLTKRPARPRSASVCTT